MKLPRPNQRPGVIATITVLGVALVVLAGFLTLSTLSTSQLTQGLTIQDSEQTYFAAESGLNLALVKLPVATLPTIAPFEVNGAQVTVEIEIQPNNPYGRVITSRAVHPHGQTRTIQVTVETSTFATSLDYAVHAGPGGLVLNNGSRVLGDVFSNGNIIPNGPGDLGEILPADTDPFGFPGHVQIAGADHRLEQMSVSGDVRAAILQGRNGRKITIGGHAYYQTIDQNDYVTAGGEACLTDSSNDFCHHNTPAPTSQPLPISDDIISVWSNDIQNAVNSAIVDGSGQTLGPTPVSGELVLGPTKINGDLTFDPNAVLVVNGPLWVTGDLILNNNASVTVTANALVGQDLYLDNNTTFRLADSLGENDGVVIANGQITVRNGANISGSGDPHSSLTLISTKAPAELASPAIYASNTAVGVIYYTNHGLVRVSETGDLNAVMADTIYLDNNAAVRFLPQLQIVTVPNPDPEPIGVQPGTWQEL